MRIWTGFVFLLWFLGLLLSPGATPGWRYHDNAGLGLHLAEDCAHCQPQAGCCSDEAPACDCQLSQSPQERELPVAAPSPPSPDFTLAQSSTPGIACIQNVSAQVLFFPIGLPPPKPEIRSFSNRGPPDQN